MTAQFLTLKKATKDNILRCINDGGFGCESVEEADIDIYAVYDNGYKVYDRTIHIDSPIHTKLFMKGI